MGTSPPGCWRVQAGTDWSPARGDCPSHHSTGRPPNGWRNGARWTTGPKWTVPSMQAMPTDIGLARHQAFSAATLLILGSGLALYQMTSLMLGPAGSRQLDLSLSIPTVETHDLAPAATGGVIGSRIIPLSLAPPSTSAPTYRTSSRSVASPQPTWAAPTPPVAPPAAVTVPPGAPPPPPPEPQ